MDITYTHRTFSRAIGELEGILLECGQEVETISWQGTTMGGATIETLNRHITVWPPWSTINLQEDIRPSLPWADHHFEERVSRIPHNPPPSHTEWPFWRESSEETKEVEGGKFSHTYPERYWCPSHPGIRYPWGNLDDLIALLKRDPLTRQAYLPVWFPEDTGASHGGRVPCSLGYHFMLRHNRLHVWYTIRSCDVLRHLRDDIYLTCRLLLWVLDELKRAELSTWKEVEPGFFSMHIFSLHMFMADRPVLEYQRRQRK